MKPQPKLSAAFAVLAVLVLASCATLKETDFITVQRPAPPPSTPFTFDAAKEGTPTDITIGVLAASYKTGLGLAGSLSERSAALSTDLQNALSRDVESMLVAKGFRVPGQFASLDQMTFPQKDKTTMVLVPTISLSVVTQPGITSLIYWRSNRPSGPPKTEPMKIFRGKVMLGGDKYEESGQFTLRGSIDLQLLEPLTGQLLWTKGVPVSESSKGWTRYYWNEGFTDNKGNVVCTEEHPVPGYDERDAALTTLLADAYRATLTQLSKYLSREEIVHLNADATKLKDRWRASGK